MARHRKNINQAALFDWIAQLDQLEQVNSELNMVESLGPLELSTIVEKQIDWVDGG